MRFLLNVLWLVLSGFWLFLGYVIAGAIWCLTIIGIPFGVASFRIGGYALWPFGREVVRRSSAGAPSAVGNVIWFLFPGIWLVIGHAISGAVLCLTVVGIPLGIANFKMVPVALTPLGRDIVSGRDLVDAWAARRH